MLTENQNPGVASSNAQVLKSQETSLAFFQFPESTFRILNAFFGPIPLLGFLLLV
jgi:hypothetical protein